MMILLTIIIFIIHKLILLIPIYGYKYNTSIQISFQHLNKLFASIIALNY